MPANGTSEIPDDAFPKGSGRPTRVFLEQGDKDRGYEHMAVGHGKHFEKKGIPESEQATRLPVLAEASSTVGRHIGYASAKRTPGRPVMATYMKDEGKVHQHALSISSNGYVVGMAPCSEENVRRRQGDPKSVSDKTLENLYYYPPNHPTRRSTQQVEGSPKTEAPKKQPTF